MSRVVQGFVYFVVSLVIPGDIACREIVYRYIIIVQSCTIQYIAAGEVLRQLLHIKCDHKCVR